MSNLARLEFTALDVSGRNYLEWVMDAELHLTSNKLENTIIENSDASQQDCAKAMILLRHHLHESLKAQYLTVKNPYELWSSLKSRFHHQKTVTLPRARHEWLNLRLQDFKNVFDYNSELCRIVSTLKLCGENISDEDMLEKTFSTFHANNIVLQQQYRAQNFKTYSELLSTLILAEENNQLLLSNHQARPTGSAPLPDQNFKSEVNATFSRRGRGRGYSRGRGRGRGNSRDGSGQRRNFTWTNPNIQKNVDTKRKGQVQREKPKTHAENVCYRCGDTGHWSRTCRASKYVVKLYQDSLKGKEKSVEVNFAEASNPENTHLEATDFLQQVQANNDLPNYGIRFGDIQLDEI